MKQIIQLFILVITFMLPCMILPDLRDLQTKKLNLVLYSGKWTETNLLNILFKQETDYRASWIAVGGLSYQLDYVFKNLDFETEGHLVKHFGKMKHTEFNGLLITRWSNFIPGLPISLAFGEGLSLASSKPGMEERNKNLFLLRFKGQKTNPLLNFLMLEIDFPLYNAKYKPKAFLRIHHRSGVFGLFCPPTCGSNFISYGFKFSLGDI